MNAAFAIERIEKPAVVEGFTVTFTPEQLLYVTAVIGKTVRSGSIPRHSQGLYDALSEALVSAGLLDKEWQVDPPTALVNDDGVPYAINLFAHLGLEKV